MKLRKRTCGIIALGLILGTMAQATVLLTLQARQVRRLCDLSSEECLAMAVIDGKHQLSRSFHLWLGVKPQPVVLNSMGDVDVPERERLRYALALLDLERVRVRKGPIISCRELLGPGTWHHDTREAIQWRLDSLQ